GTTSESLSFENGHDFVCSRINDHNFIAYEDVVITTPLGIDRDNFSRQRVEVHAFGYAGSNPYRDVKVNGLHFVFTDDRRDLGPLLGREFRRARCRALTGRRTVLLGRRLA